VTKRGSQVAWGRMLWRHCLGRGAAPMRVFGLGCDALRPRAALIILV
jgi:hypothetical protein